MKSALGIAGPAVTHAEGLTLKDPADLETACHLFSDTLEVPWSAEGKGVGGMDKVVSVKGKREILESRNFSLQCSIDPERGSLSPKYSDRFRGDIDRVNRPASVK